MTDYPTLTMNDDRQIPQLGFGTYKIDNDDAPAAVKTAIETGYWLIDTAAVYGNEEGVGRGIGDWSDIFIQTKIWNESQGFDRTKKAFDKCLSRLNRDHVDMLLMHWPCPEQDLFVETWKAFIDLREEGRAKSIGVSNFREEDLKRIVDETGVTPALNQVEVHPNFQQRDLRLLHNEMGIVTQCWSPLGQGAALDRGPIREIADEIGQPVSAVVVRWHMQCGNVPIPKSTQADHIRDNFKALKFELTDAQMKSIDDLDDPDGRMGPDPADYC